MPCFCLVDVTVPHERSSSFHKSYMSEMEKICQQMHRPGIFNQQMQHVYLKQNLNVFKKLAKVVLNAFRRLTIHK